MDYVGEFEDLLNFEHGVAVSLKNIAVYPNVYEDDWRGNTKLHTYLKELKVTETVVEQLLDLGAFVNRTNYSGMTPLHCALSNKNCEISIVRLLLEKGADVRMLDDHRKSCLHYAVKNKGISVDVLEFLAESGADVHVVDEHGSLLDYALFNNQLSPDVIKWLFEKVADISAANEHGVTLLHWAAQLNRRDVVKLILEKKIVEISLPDTEGNTPLHYVFSKMEADPEVVKLLLEARADVNRKNKVGEQPLHLAARQCNPSVIKLLLNYGACANEDNKNKATPLDIALVYKKGNRVAVKMLLDAGALVFKGHPSILDFENPFHCAILLYQHNRNWCLPERAEEDLKVIRLLLKYALLERREQSYHLLGLDEEIVRSLKVFEEQCRRELQSVCTKTKVTLEEFILYVRLCKTCPTPEIIQVLSRNAHPIYKEVIVSLMNREDLEEGFKCYPVYAVPEENSERRAVLNYDSSCYVMKHLTDDDLLNLLLAVYHT